MSSTQVEARSILLVTLSKTKIPSKWRRFLPPSVRSLPCFRHLLVTRGCRPFTWGHYRNAGGSRIHRKYNSVSIGIRFLTLPVGRLKSSRFDVPDIINHITHCFDETTKRLFKSLDDASYIQFGSPVETEADLGIQRGKMKLSGFVSPPTPTTGISFSRVFTRPEVASFFEASIEGTIDAIESHLHSLKANDSVSA